MKLEYSGQEQISAEPLVVWEFVTDPDRIGRSVPDIVDVIVHNVTHFDAIVGVNVGPVRGRFKLKCELEPDPSRRVLVRISGGGFGSAVDVVATADVLPAGDMATTLRWMADADIRGPIAAVGGRVLDAQARRIIGQAFANVRERLSPQPEQPSNVAPPSL